MQFDNKPGLHPELEAMDTHELNNLLRREGEKPIAEIDEELVRAIWMTLEQRVADPLPDDPAAEAAADKYRAGCKKAHGRRVKLWMRLCVAAAALCLLLTAIPRASGESLLVEFFQKVRADVVAFFHPDEKDNRLVSDYEIVHPGLEELRQTVVDYGVTVPVVPSWIPEGYELIEVKTVEYPSKTRLVACFSAESKTIVIAYELYEISSTTEFIKDEAEHAEFEAAGIIHKIYTNNGKQFALWNRENMQCSIVVDCQEENLTKILDSIYNMED